MEKQIHVNWKYRMTKLELEGETSIKQNTGFTVLLYCKAYVC